MKSIKKKIKIYLLIHFLKYKKDFKIYEKMLEKHLDFYNLKYNGLVK